MSIMTAIGMGFSIAGGVTSMLSSQKSKEAAKEMAKYQSELATQQYQTNLEILSENFVNNALINYDTIAKQMANLTSEYTQARNNSLMSTASYFSGGASYNSNRENTIATLNLDYNTKVFEYNNLRIYNEDTIKKQFSNSVLNLGTQYKNTMYNISAGLYQTEQAANQATLNSLVNMGANIFGILGYTGNNANTSPFREIPKSEWVG